MRRVLVIGSGGSGKSTLARALGDRTDLPVVHLDRLYWEPGWVEVSEEEFDARLADALSGDAWIIDGNYTRTMATRIAAADTVVFLDRTRWRCFARAVWRRFAYVGRTRESMTPGCPERITWEFLGYIWKYPRKRPAVLAMLADFQAKGGRVVVLKSDAQADAFLAAAART